jgi:hypothetical protein
LQCNEEKIKRKLMAIATGLINDNAMQCGSEATDERSCDDRGTTIKAAMIAFRGELRAKHRDATSRQAALAITCGQDLVFEWIACTHCSILDTIFIGAPTSRTYGAYDAVEICGRDFSLGLEQY